MRTFSRFFLFCSVRFGSEESEQARRFYEDFLFSDVEDVEKRDRMKERLRSCNFRNIDISESIEHNEKNTPDECFLYMPDNTDSDIRDKLKDRFV